MKRHKNYMNMNGIRILSRDVWAFLLCFTLSAAAEGGLQSGLSTSHHDYWAVEDAKEREKLPLYKSPSRRETG